MRHSSGLTTKFFIFCGLSLLFSACGPKTASNSLSHSLNLEDNDFSSGFIFTILEKKMVDSASYVSGYAAAATAWADHVEYRFVGLASTENLDRETYRLIDRQSNALQGTMTCGRSPCDFNLHARGESCPVVSLAISHEFTIPCGNIGYVHLASRFNLISDNDKVSPRRPTTQFEFLAMGSMLDRNEQVLPLVSRDRPLIFAVDQQLQAQPQFIEDLAFAFHYWNQMIGFDALRYDLNAHASSNFDPTASLFFFEKCESCGGDARTAYYADPISGKIISGKIDIYPSVLSMTTAGRRNTLTHELGHVLGLAHNDAASEDLKNQPASGFTSVMDIGEPDLTSPLPYDAAAIDWLYRGKLPEIEFKHCSDPQVLYVLGCDNADFAASRRISSKQWAEVLLQQVQSVPELLRNDISNADDGSLNTKMNILTSAFQGNDGSWAFQFLKLARSHLDLTFINSHKVIALKSQPDDEAREAWLNVFKFTLNDSRVVYTPAQRALLEFAEMVIRERPINPTTIDKFVKNATVEKL
jgi:hypothetical protein